MRPPARAVPSGVRRFLHRLLQVPLLYKILVANAAIVTVGAAAGARLEGAVHAHARLAVQAGASADEIRHVVLLALTTLGFPTMMAVRTWVDEVLAP